MGNIRRVGCKVKREARILIKLCVQPLQQLPRYHTGRDPGGG